MLHGLSVLLVKQDKKPASSRVAVVVVAAAAHDFNASTQEPEAADL